MALNKESAVTWLAAMFRVIRGGLEAPDRNKKNHRQNHGGRPRLHPPFLEMIKISLIGIPR